MTALIQINIGSGAKDSITNKIDSLNNSTARIFHKEVGTEGYRMQPCSQFQRYESFKVWVNLCNIENWKRAYILLPHKVVCWLAPARDLHAATTEPCALEPAHGNQREAHARQRKIPHAVTKTQAANQSILKRKINVPNLFFFDDKGL